MSQADHKHFVAVVRIVDQDVPQNWFAANLNHGFLFELCVLTQTGGKGPGKNGDFIRIPRLRADRDQARPEASARPGWHAGSAS
jgi:hypothetical protein